MYLEIIVGLVISYSVLFLLSLLLKDNSIVDIFWPIGFLQVTIHSIYLSNIFSLIQVILFILIFVWASRLSVHILIKRIKKGKEDPRYVKWRNEWKYFYLRSIFQVYILQGFLLLLVSTAIIFLNLNPLGVTFLTYLGIIISIFGLTFESISDNQLKSFLSDKNNKGKIMQVGLWKYSRHPNYFGESMFWLGISILGFSSSFYSIISFITITFLLRYVSGVPMSEKNYLDRKDFIEYAKKTPAFIPKLF